MEKKVPKRIANIIMNALQGGVVPRTGLGYIAVGRKQEIDALLKDLELIEDGGATFRFVVGDYGSGKTFLIQTIKEYALTKGFIVADADLSPDRALVGTMVNKRGLATYRELMRNLSVKTSPEGGALEKVLDQWLDSIWVEIAQSLTGGMNGLEMREMVSKKIESVILSMNEMVGGFDFAKVMTIYWSAKQTGDTETKYKALKWLRGEYRVKTEAANELGITTIINDDDWFEYIKLFSEFFSKIGYKGFIVTIDEMINIYRSASPSTRQKNYEKMLNMYNDALQGKANHLGLILGGTPKSVNNEVRGVFSYPALKSRLESSRFNSANMVNLMTPIIMIQPLDKSEIILLLDILVSLHSDIYGYDAKVNDQNLINFINVIYNDRAHALITPRSIIRGFIDVLNILYQNPSKNIDEVLELYEFTDDVEEEATDIYN